MPHKFHLYLILDDQALVPVKACVKTVGCILGLANIILYKSPKLKLDFMNVCQILKISVMSSFIFTHKINTKKNCRYPVKGNEVVEFQLPKSIKFFW